MSLSNANEGLPPRQPTAIERAALEWVARLDGGRTPELEAEFERWLASDVRHAEIFGEIDGTWGLLNRLDETPEGTTEIRSGEIDPDAFAPASQTFHSAGQKNRRRAWSGIARRRWLKLRSRTWEMRRWAAAASLTVAALFAVVYLGWSPPRIDDEQSTLYSGSVATELGEVRKINLPDGSIVQLNTDSTMEVQFSSTRRQVRLTRGEAHFTVAKNRLRPFVVNAGGVDVKAVGTAFNVRLRAEAVEVLVTKGTVRIGDDAIGSEGSGAAGSAEVHDIRTRDGSFDTASLRPPIFERHSLGAGEKITISLASGSETFAPSSPVPVPLVEIERALAWQERRLEFVSAPLGEMVAEFNRYNLRKLVIPDAGLATQHFGGTFRLDDPDAFVRVLEANFGVLAEQQGENTILRLAEP